MFKFSTAQSIAENFRTSIRLMGCQTSIFEHLGRGHSDWFGSTYAEHVSASFTHWRDYEVSPR